MGWLRQLRRRVRAFEGETIALYYAVRDPRTPWYAKLVAGAIVAYALSPIDLIPDFIPVLGYLDDIILIPLGIALAIRLVPLEVLVEARTRAAARMVRPSRSRAAAVLIIALWIAAALLVGWWGWSLIAQAPGAAGSA